MKVEEAIKIINESEEVVYSIYEAEKLIKYETFLTENNIERHRWYETCDSFYQMEDGILGISGLSHLYSENTEPSNCNEICHAFEAEEYPTIDYRAKAK